MTARTALAAALMSAAAHAAWFGDLWPSGQTNSFTNCIDKVTKNFEHVTNAVNIATNAVLVDAAARDVAATNAAVLDAKVRDVAATNAAILDASARDIAATNAAVLNAAGRDTAATNAAIIDAAVRIAASTNGLAGANLVTISNQFILKTGDVLSQGLLVVTNDSSAQKVQIGYSYNYLSIGLDPNGFDGGAPSLMMITATNAGKIGVYTHELAPVRFEVANPIEIGDAATKSYVDTQINTLSVETDSANNGYYNRWFVLDAFDNTFTWTPTSTENILGQIVNTGADSAQGVWQLCPPLLATGLVVDVFVYAKTIWTPCTLSNKYVAFSVVESNVSYVVNNESTNAIPNHGTWMRYSMSTRPHMSIVFYAQYSALDGTGLVTRIRYKYAK
jgi:hypothetical protein